jgi:hypothetical protein
LLPLLHANLLRRPLQQQPLRLLVKFLLPALNSVHKHSDKRRRSVATMMMKKWLFALHRRSPSPTRLRLWPDQLQPLLLVHPLFNELPHPLPLVRLLQLAR